MPAQDQPESRVSPIQPCHRLDCPGAASAPQAGISASFACASLFLRPSFLVSHAGLQSAAGAADPGEEPLGMRCSQSPGRAPGGHLRRSSSDRGIGRSSCPTAPRDTSTAGRRGHRSQLQCRGSKHPRSRLWDHSHVESVNRCHKSPHHLCTSSETRKGPSFRQAHLSDVTRALQTLPFQLRRPREREGPSAPAFRAAQPAQPLLQAAQTLLVGRRLEPAPGHSSLPQLLLNGQSTEHSLR